MLYILYFMFYVKFFQCHAKKFIQVNVSSSQQYLLWFRYLFISFKPKKIVSSFLYFSLIFGLVEFIRGLILTGFPWNLIAYSFSNQLEILGVISVIGTYGFNLFCISLFTSPALLFLRKSKKEFSIFQQQTKKQQKHFNTVVIQKVLYPPLNLPTHLQF